MRKESVNDKWKLTFNYGIIFDGLVGIEEITNIRLEICEFEPQITRFFVQSASLFA